jgi:hypothetical protein
MPSTFSSASESRAAFPSAMPCFASVNGLRTCSGFPLRIAVAAKIVAKSEPICRREPDAGSSKQDLRHHALVLML